MNGSGTPVVGKNELATLMFIKAWNVIEKVIPTAKSFPYISGQWVAITNPLCINVKNNPITSTQPTNPSSSAIIAKIKSVCLPVKAVAVCPSSTPVRRPEASVS